MRTVSEHTKEIRRQIVAIVDDAAMTMGEISTRMGLRYPRGAEHHMEALRNLGLVVNYKLNNACWLWMTPRRMVELFPEAAREQEITATQTVRIYPLPEMPKPIIMIEGKVKITRQSAPKGRFDVELSPGAGQITRDWLERRGFV